MTDRAPIPDLVVCGGRRLDSDDQPVGPPCGTRYHPECPRCTTTWQRPAEADRHALQVVTSARAAGWRIGPPDARGVRNAMCPPCAGTAPTLSPTSPPTTDGQLDLFA